MGYSEAFAVDSQFEAFEAEALLDSIEDRIENDPASFDPDPMQADRESWDIREACDSIA